MATPRANMLSSVHSTTWRNEYGITGCIMAARTQGRRDMRSRGRYRSCIWALGGRIWAVSETLAMGLGLAISLGPADRDLLSEPTCSRRGGLPPRNSSSISLSLAKAEFIRLASKTAAAGEGGGGCVCVCVLVTLVDIEPQLQRFEYSLILLNSFRYPPNVDQGVKLPSEETHGTP